MGRLVYHTSNEPYRIDPQDKPVFICACGLSKVKPLCDNSHVHCQKNEQPGKVYFYDKELTEIAKDEANSSKKD